MTDAAVDISPEPSTDTDAPESTWQHDAGLDGDVNFEKFSSVSDLAKGYSEATAMIGGAIRFPSKEAGEEDISKFNEDMIGKGFYRAPNMDDTDSVRGIQKLLGLPSEAQGYNFDEVEGFEGDAESEGAFKSVAHELGLTTSQANGIHNWLGTNLSADQKSAGEKASASMAELKGEWGQAFDHKIENAKNAATQLEERVPGISEYFDNMAENGEDASMIRLMDAVSEMLGEGGATQSQPRETMTKAEAESRIREIQNNPDHPANNPQDPHHEEAAKQRVELFKAAYGG